jgi:hypothetical protein
MVCQNEAVLCQYVQFSSLGPGLPISIANLIVARTVPLRQWEECGVY